VTVIAGGFEKEIRELGSPLPLGIKVPIEEGEEPKDENVKKIIEENKELEIPAFLRKKK